MARHGLPIVTVVVNNESWAMSLHGQEIIYGPETGVISGLADTDFERVAQGFGARGAGRAGSRRSGPPSGPRSTTTVRR